MSRLKMPVKTIVVIAVMAVFSCSKEPVGYIEVRNLTNDTFTDVTWGGLIHFGTIAPGEEKGDETESFTGKYLYLEIGNGTYRSRKEIFVDANSSATFTVHDMNQLENVE